MCAARGLHHIGAGSKPVQAVSALGIKHAQLPIGGAAVLWVRAPDAEGGEKQLAGFAVVNEDTPSTKWLVHRAGACCHCGSLWEKSPRRLQESCGGARASCGGACVSRMN